MTLIRLSPSGPPVTDVLTGSVYPPPGPPAGWPTGSGIELERRQVGSGNIQYTAPAGATLQTIGDGGTFPALIPWALTPPPSSAGPVLGSFRVQLSLGYSSLNSTEELRNLELYLALQYNPNGAGWLELTWESPAVNHPNGIGQIEDTVAAESRHVGQTAIQGDLVVPLAALTEIQFRAAWRVPGEGALAVWSGNADIPEVSTRWSFEVARHEYTPAP